MISHLSHVMTLANSVIGVSVLAMPYCFKQCGIVLGIIVLLSSSALSRLACHFLIKSAVMSRRRNFESLAFHAFGHMGKFLVELFIIGFLLGTCIAFFVVVGDLGPQIVGKIINRDPEDIRTSFLITTGTFIVLPLGLLKNIDSLSSVSTATIGFYLCLVLKVVAEATQHIFAGDWYDCVYYWRPAGILQCLPIFSMALFCQTQLFEIYEVIPNVCLEKMNHVVRGALNICTIVYVFVGFFGYVAFCTQPFTGNILMSFQPNLMSEVIKMGFVLSVAFSFPLVIFPCRASLNSLFFHKVHAYESSSNYIPEVRFRCLTFTIVLISLIVGILIPNIEFVLGFVGSTIGVMICLIFPAIFFISISSKHTNERMLAQIILFTGVWIMVLGTYANLYAIEESVNINPVMITGKPIDQVNNVPLNPIIKNILPVMKDIPIEAQVAKKVKEKLQLPEGKVIQKNSDVKEVRQEPPVPVERIIITEKAIAEVKESENLQLVTLSPEIKEIVEQIKKLDVKSNPKTVAKDKDSKDLKQKPLIVRPDQVKATGDNEKAIELHKNDNSIDSDAIKKEEIELAADKELNKAEAVQREREKFKETLEKHKIEMIELHDEILKDIKEIEKQGLESKTRFAQNTIQNRNKNKADSQIQDPPQPRTKVGEQPDGGVENVGKAKNEKSDIPANIPDEKEKLNFEKIQDLPLEPNNNAVQQSDVDNDQEVKTNIKNEIASNNDENILKSVVVATQSSKSQGRNLTSPDSQKLSGPVLNVLTKKPLKRTIPKDTLANENNDSQAIKAVELAEQDKKSNDKEIDKTAQFSIPIALMMNDKTKKKEHSNEPRPNKTDDQVVVMRREILQNHERQKRETDKKLDHGESAEPNDLRPDEMKITETKHLPNTRKECSKIEKDSGKTKLPNTYDLSEEKSRKFNPTTELLLIKTNSYLSEQEFTEKISIEQNIVMNSDLKLPKRDLKFLKSSNNDKV